MGIFDKLFGRRNEANESPQPDNSAVTGGAAEPTAPAASPSAASAAAVSSAPPPPPAAEVYSRALVCQYDSDTPGLPPIFPHFQPVRPMAETTIEKYASQVPEAVVEMWRTYGEGFVGDGYLRILDPGTISPEGQLNPDPGAVALMNTALNDTIFWHGPAKAFVCAKWRLGLLDLVSGNNPEDPRAVLASLGDPAFQERGLENRHFQEWVGHGGGVPALTHGLFYVPAPAIGGGYRSENLELGESFVSQMIYLNFDAPKLRYENPNQIVPVEDFGAPRARG